ncbi:MAG: helix-turn-helix transcriptional regulator [Clostridia bacterium]|nr:helix-turn-helix transcriptional regulator [Clostridia bacterium]
MKNLKYGNYNGFGIFDSKIDLPKDYKSTYREVVGFELDYITESNGYFFIDDIPYKLTPNTLCLKKPGQRCKSSMDFKSIFLCFSLPNDSPDYEMLMQAPNHFIFPTQNKYPYILNDIFEAMIANTEETKELVNIKMRELFYYIKKDSATSINKINEMKYSLLFKKIIGYIQQNISKNITLNDLAHEFSYSPTYLQKLFKQHIGISPHKFAENLKIDNSIKLLRITQKSISDIAYACGFSDQAHYTKTFEKTMGITPLKYRKLYSTTYPDNF